MNEKKTKMELLSEERVPRALMKLGIPTMAGMLVSALYNAIDAYFVGGLGIRQMGAVSVVFPIVQLVIGLGMMFGAGASSYISRLLGKEEYREADKVASTALISGMMTGAVIIIGILCNLDLVLTGLGATETILPYARAYARIYIAGSILNVFTVCMNNLLTAQGATRVTMLAMLSGSIANVILDPVLIYGLNLGIEGAAAATALSLCINAAFYVTYILRRKGVLRLSVRNFTWSKKIYGEILKIGIPVLAFQLFASVSLGLTNMAAKRYGDYAVAAMGAVSKIITIGTYVVFGFMKGFQPFAGYNYGAGQYQRLKDAIRLCCLWSAVFCALGGCTCAVFSKQVISLFGTDKGMILFGSKVLLVNAVTFVTFGFQMVYASLYLAVGKSMIGSILSLGRQGLFFIPLILILPKVSGIDGLIWAQPAADLIAAAVTVLFAVQTDRRLGLKQKWKVNTKYS